ncbi:MAG: hypothetical protein KF731_12430, partial [Thauera sp.]|nr:hypothetical protein [Thauera sp.]
EFIAVPAHDSSLAIAVSDHIQLRNSRAVPSFVEALCANKERMIEAIAPAHMKPKICQGTFR